MNFAFTAPFSKGTRTEFGTSITAYVLYGTRLPICTWHGGNNQFNSIYTCICCFVSDATYPKGTRESITEDKKIVKPCVSR